MFSWITWLHSIGRRYNYISFKASCDCKRERMWIRKLKCLCLTGNESKRGAEFRNRNSP